MKKFRFWNTIARRFQPASQYAIDGEGKLIGYDYETQAYDDPSDFKDTCIVAQQFTGMKDTNGPAVYEGDWVAEKITAEMAANGDSANVGLIFFAAGTFMINGDGPLYEHVFSNSPDVLEDYLVIGNAFENPELNLS